MKRLTQDAHLESIAIAHDVTTFMMPAPNGGFLIYVSPREKDVTRGVMSALIDIKIKRGETGGETDTVKIRKVGIATPGHEIYYELKNADGSVACCGYAPTEAIARSRMADFERNRSDEQ